MNKIGILKRLLCPLMLLLTIFVRGIHAEVHIYENSSDLIISSICKINDEYKFSVYDSSNQRRFWIASGQHYKNYTFVGYDPINYEVKLLKDGINQSVKLIKANEHPIIVLHQGIDQASSKKLIVQQNLPSTAEIEAFRKQEYSQLPDKTHRLYTIKKQAADNKIEAFSRTIAEESLPQKQVDDPLNNRNKNVILLGRKNPSRVPTTIHSSVFKESQKNKD